MAFTVKDWKDEPDHTTPISAAALEDMETRLSAYTDSEAGLLIPKSLAGAKGDLFVATADDTPARKAVGANGRVLTADSAQGDGLAWAVPPGSNSYIPIEAQRSTVGGGAAAATYIFCTTFFIVAGGNSSAGGAFYLDPALWAMPGFTTKYRLRAMAGVNDVAPAITLTLGLHPVTTITGATTANAAVSGAVSGSTLAFASPAANSKNQGNSGDFTPPAADYFVFGCVTSGIGTANSQTHIAVRLEVRYV